MLPQLLGRLGNADHGQSAQADRYRQASAQHIRHGSLNREVGTTMVDIIHRIGIKAPLSKVLQAGSTVEGVGGVWAKATNGTSGSGGGRTAGFADRAGKEIGKMDFKVTKVDPDKTVHWRFTDGPPEWVGTDVTFDLSRQGDYTIVVFGHRNWREAVEFTAHCSMKWATFLLSLRALAETGTGRPGPDDLKIDNWN